ncbi:MAG: DUF3159 domain-containing protein [Ardenticatenaceae bacterium]|nr:DUF3159 domain-containing protein [Ardenticatenaceae bacterium]MCB9445419.1 DUF3159 domain-containing protein [Ardenticatenaceae bacterium]
MPNKLSELLQELRDVVLSSRSIIDIVLPPLLFLVLAKWWGFSYAVWGSLSLAVLFLIWRVVRHQSIWTAVAGVAGVLLSLALVQILNREEGFFLPGILTGVGTALLALGSIVAGKPMVAWTSYLARRWPWDWYWHPRVRPAYTEVTWFWAIFFLVRVGLQLNLFQAAQAEQLAGVNLLLGWPATLLLLIFSYLYGTWRLHRLGGPSVTEFQENAPPPWQGQRRGF